MIPHVKSDNGEDAPLPFKVLEVSCPVYRRTPATHLNRDQERQRLVQWGSGSHSKWVWGMVSW